MTCLACQDREHDCCDNVLLPGSCVCGCVRILDPPALRSGVVIILGGAPHDQAACGRAFWNAQRRHKRARREVA